MWIWDQLRSVAGRVTGRNNLSFSSDSGESRGFYGSDVAATVTKFGDAVRANGAQRLEDFVPDPEHREKIGRIVTNLGKFAVNSAVDESLKSVKGGIQVYKIVKERLKDQPSHSAQIKKPDLPVAVEEMQAKLEKMQEDINNMKQLNSTPTNCVESSDSLKESLTEPSDELAPLKSDGRKIFIRSRL